jgi:hypothetical protein
VIDLHANVAEIQPLRPVGRSQAHGSRDAYGFVRVRGEMSGDRGPHSSGHVYFALKGENAKIDAAIACSGRRIFWGVQCKVCR